MIISELIQILQERMKESGDLPVMILTDGGYDAEDLLEEEITAGTFRKWDKMRPARGKLVSEIDCLYISHYEF